MKKHVVFLHVSLNFFSTMGDPWGRENLSNLATSFPYLKRMHPVGRLDADTAGLLLFSRNGVLTRLLLDPASAVPRVYEAVVAGGAAPLQADAPQIRRRLREGVRTSDGLFRASVLHTAPYQGQPPLHELDLSQTSPFTSSSRRTRREQLEEEKEEGREGDEMQGAVYSDGYSDDDEYNEGGREVAGTDSAGDGVGIIGMGNDSSMVLSCIRLSVTEGKHRMVRRMLHNAGHTVVHLRRVSFGDIGLDGTVGLGGDVADEAEGDGNDSVDSGSDSDDDDDDEEEVRVTAGATGARGVVSMQQKEAAAVEEGVLPVGAVRLCSEQEARWAARLMRAALRREEALKAAAKQAEEAGGANAEAASSRSSSNRSSNSNSRGRMQGAARKNAETGKIGTGVSKSLRESLGEVGNSKSFKLTSMLTDLTKGNLRNPIKPSSDVSGSTSVGGAKGTNMKNKDFEIY
jgi:16S rRNA U516 pseudouridylate synthase RsuA-like enzyme